MNGLSFDDVLALTRAGYSKADIEAMQNPGNPEPAPEPNPGNPEPAPEPNPGNPEPAPEPEPKPEPKPGGNPFEAVLDGKKFDEFMDLQKKMFAAIQEGNRRADGELNDRKEKDPMRAYLR